MEKAVLRKGNLYNPLTQSIDNLLLDSDQYDLEVTIEGIVKYYRVRYSNSFFEAEEVKPKSFNIHKFNTGPIAVEEAKSFTRTTFFKENIKDKKYFPKMESGDEEAYYASLQRRKGKRIINNSKKVYSFTLPSLGIREKHDVSHYDIEIEQACNKYYVVFITEKVNEYGLQRTAPLYMIYDKKDFEKMKSSIEELVINIAIEEDYPLKLLEYVYIATGGEPPLIANFFQVLEKAKSIEEVLNNPLVRRVVSKNEDVKIELIKYLNGEQDDINYTYKKQ